MRFRSLLAAYPGVVAAMVFAMVAVIGAAIALADLVRAQSERDRVSYAFEQEQQIARQKAVTREAAVKAIPYQAQLEGIARKLQQKVTEGALLSQMQTLAERADVRLTSFKVADRRLDKGFAFSEYVEIEGSYLAVRRFITDLPQLPMVVVVGNTILERSSHAHGQVHSTLEIVVVAQEERSSDDLEGFPASHVITQVLGLPQSSKKIRDLFFENNAAVETTKRALLVLPTLVGVVTQGGVPSAFFLIDGQSATGSEGDQIAGRYWVMKIDTSFVVIEDASTGNRYRIPLSGK